MLPYRENSVMEMDMQGCHTARLPGSLPLSFFLLLTTLLVFGYLMKFSVRGTFHPLICRRKSLVSRMASK